MKFENKVVVLTGGVKGIGRCIKETFEKQDEKRLKYRKIRKRSKLNEIHS